MTIFILNSLILSSDRSFSSREIFRLTRVWGMGLLNGKPKPQRGYSTANLRSSASSKAYRPEALALEHINSNNPTTSDIINNLLLNQQVSITQKELDDLLKIPSVKFKLPISNDVFPAYSGLVAKPQTRIRRLGVYIFTHVASGDSYGGSSKSLSRRLSQYLDEDGLFNNKTTGLFLPLLEKYGQSAFTLEIFVVVGRSPRRSRPASSPPAFSSEHYYLFLEQYLLLDKQFNLNTQRIVNFRVNQGTSIYMYDLKSKILYHTSPSLNAIRLDLGIQHSTCTRCIKTGVPYLDFLIITDKPVANAVNANLSLMELHNLMLQKRALSLKSYSKYTSKAIYLKSVETGSIESFPSIISVVRHFESINIIANRNKISECLKTGESYLGYTYSITSI
jgi:hypothetical protein